MSQLKFIDVSGVGSSGKSAVVDYLREFEKIWVPDHLFEFDLIRAPGGVLDLHHALCEDWSPIRSNNAILRFSKLIEIVGKSGSPLDIVSMANSTGNRYERVFENKFFHYSEQFINSFIVGKFKAFWPYNDYEAGAFRRFRNKIYRKAKLNQHLMSDVLLAEARNNDYFRDQFSQYMNSLFKILCKKGEERVVLNNSFEPFNPQRSLNILEGAKTIIVIRDPRDSYVSGQSAHKINKNDVKLQAQENDGINKSFLATDDLSLFIKRQQVYLNHLKSKNSENILFIRFENLVLNYEEETNRINDFLGLNKKEHLNPCKFFDPNSSKKNISAYKYFSDQRSVQEIKNKLEPYFEFYE